MRLLCVGNRYPPWSLGGYEVLWAGTVEALRARGHTVRVLTTLPDPSDRTHPAARASDVHRELSWYWRDHAFPPMGARASAQLERANAAVFSRHLRDFAPDVLAWWSMGGMSLSLLAQAARAGLRAVGVVGDDWMVYGPGVDGWTGRWRGRALGLGAGLAGRLAGVPATVNIGAAARWVFISHYTLEAARAAGVGLSEPVVAHPGVDQARFRWREPGPWRRRLLYCGRVEERKGVGTAVEALAALPADAMLTIDGFGSDAYVAELEALAADRGVRDRVHFQCSPRDRLLDVYAAADTIVFPVRWREPWGLVPLEAMAVGRPVVASHAGGGAAEYLRDGHNCVQFEPGDASGLAAAVQRLGSSPELVASLRSGGLETASRFTDRAFHAVIERELEAALADRRP